MSRREAGRSKIRIQLVSAGEGGFFRKTSRGVKRGVTGYAQECLDGFASYPLALYEGARRVKDELEAQSSEDRKLGLYILGFYGLATVVALLFWYLLRGWVGPIPMLLLGFVWYSPKRQAVLRRWFRRWFIGGDDPEVGGRREIPMETLRLLARTRLRVIARKCAEWEKLSHEGQLQQAPTIAYDILRILGSEFEAPRVVEAPSQPEGTTES